MEAPSNRREPRIRKLRARSLREAGGLIGRQQSCRRFCRVQLSQARPVLLRTSRLSLFVARMAICKAKLSCDAALRQIGWRKDALTVRMILQAQIEIVPHCEPSCQYPFSLHPENS
jgi:hypothetical protein